MTQADSPSSPVLASLPTVLHGSASASDELPSDHESEGSNDAGSQAPTPSSPSTGPPPTPSQTREPSPPPPSAPGTSTNPSSRTSTSEPSFVDSVAHTGGEVTDALAFPAVRALGILANRTYVRRTLDYSDRWLFTEEESGALAGALGRIAARRLPEQLVEGEGGDLLVIVGVTGGYLVRNALGISEAQVQAATREEGAAPGPARPATSAPAPGDPVERAGEPAAAPAQGPRTAPPDQGSPGGVHVLGPEDVGAV